MSDVKKDRQTKVLCDALKEAVLQLEYLNGKFQPTGTTAAVLARIRAVLDERGARADTNADPTSGQGVSECSGKP